MLVCNQQIGFMITISFGISKFRYLFVFCIIITHQTEDEIEIKYSVTLKLFTCNKKKKLIK